VDIGIVEQFEPAELISIDRQERYLPPFGGGAITGSSLDYVGDDGPEIAEPKYGLNVDVTLGCDFAPGAQVRHQVAGRERYPSPVVDIVEIRRHGR
jgi:hypothetical protein